MIDDINTWTQEEEDAYQEHCSKEGSNYWNDNPDGCYFCGSFTHHSGDCQNKENL